MGVILNPFTGNFQIGATSGGGGGSVSDINGLSGAITLAGGTGITVTPSGNTLTIDASSPTGASNTNAYFDGSGNLTSNAEYTFDDSTNSLSLTSHGSGFPVGGRAINIIAAAGNVYTQLEAGTASFIQGVDASTDAFFGTLSAHPLFVRTGNNNRLKFDTTGVVEVLQGGALKLDGVTSGGITMSGADTTTSYTVKWPAAQGATGTVLTNSDGAGNLTWGAGAAVTAPMTNWVAYTPTFTGSGGSTNMTLTGQYRRVGDSIDIRVLASFTGAPTFTRLQVSIPAGLTINTTKILDTVSMVVGQVVYLDFGIANYSGQARYNSTTDFIISVDNTGGAFAIQNDATFVTPFTFNTGDTIDVLITSLPIDQYTF